VNPVLRCLIGGLVCLTLAGALTWAFSEDIFSKQSGSAENRILSFDSLRPDLRLELKP